MDRQFWDVYGRQIRESGFRGDLVTCQSLAGLRRIPTDGIQNSGAGALMLAVRRGADRVVLVGYDCQYAGPRRHWHADHRRPLGNAGSMPKWADQFRAMRPHLLGVEVVNATRQTALDCFPRVSLEEALGCRT